MIRIVKDIADIERVVSRVSEDYSVQLKAVRQILADVKLRGDVAVREYSKRFDGDDGSVLLVPESEIKAAYGLVSPSQLTAIKNAKDNILAYANRLVKNEREGGGLVNGVGYMLRPVSRAGIYVPGGTAAYPSSVLMCALPAVAAGVEDIVMVSPPANISPLVLVAADLCGISKIYRVGGAQAIGALAYGTESIPKVDVISGPGNIYVALAKREVFGEVGIDMIAGPSEVLIVADDSANPSFIAADMLAQCEHDVMASSILITDSISIAEGVSSEISCQLERLKRREIAEKSIEKNSVIILVDSLDSAYQLSNRFAPEHLELAVKDLAGGLEAVKCAGAVFVSSFTPEAVGDYYAGSNHVLPTGGSARFFSGLSPSVYMKKISVINFDKGMLFSAKDDIIELAEAEGLTAHAEAVRVRFL